MPQRKGFAMAQLVEELNKELDILLWGLHCNLVQLVPICLLCKRLVLISCTTSAKLGSLPTFLLAPALLAIVLLTRGAVHDLGRAAHAVLRRMDGWVPGVRLQLRLKEAGGDSNELQGEIFAYDAASDTLVLRAWRYLAIRPKLTRLQRRFGLTASGTSASFADRTFYRIL